jgi:hypothetical protein
LTDDFILHVCFAVFIPLGGYLAERPPVNYDHQAPDDALPDRLGSDLWGAFYPAG